MTEFDALPERVTDQCADAGSLPALALTEADLDHMHHALGRPVGPHVTPYRNYFATSTDSPDAKRFEETGLWVKGQGMAGGLTYYHVNTEGERRVWAWLAERNRKAGVRAYVVSGAGIISPKTVMAKSRSAAKYAAFLEFSDIVDFGYGEWLSRGPRVRLAA